MAMLPGNERRAAVAEPSVLPRADPTKVETVPSLRTFRMRWLVVSDTKVTPESLTATPPMTPNEAAALAPSAFPDSAGEPARKRMVHGPLYPADSGWLNRRLANTG